MDDRSQLLCRSLEQLWLKWLKEATRSCSSLLQGANLSRPLVFLLRALLWCNWPQGTEQAVLADL